MMNQKLKQVFWLIGAVTLGLITLSIFLFQLPNLLKAQAELEITVLPPDQSVPPGTAAAYTVFVTNTGTISLTNVFVNSGNFEFCSSFVGGFPEYGLDVGESDSYICNQASQEDITTVFTVIGDAFDTGEQTTAVSPKISLRTAHLLTLITPEIQSIVAGEAVDLTITISNTGDLELSDLAISAPAEFTNCARTVGALANLSGGSAISFACQSDALSASVEPIFNVSGVVDGSTAVTEIAYTSINVSPHFALEISPANQFVVPGESGHFVVTVRNNGQTAVANIGLTASNAATCNRYTGAIADLSANESATISCLSEPIQMDTTTTITATALIDGTPVTVVESVALEADNSVDIEVQPTNLIVPEGTAVTFTITLTNTLPADTFENVAIYAPDTPDCTRPEGVIADLASGNSFSYSCQGTAVANQREQTFQLTGRASSEVLDGDGYFAQDTAVIGLLSLNLPNVLNQYERPFTLPDLVIDSVSLDPITHNTYSIRIVTTNRSTVGVASGNNFFINAYRTTDLSTPIFVCSVQGEWFGAKQSYSCTGQITLNSDDTIRAWADPYNSVSEEFETNNTKDH